MSVAADSADSSLLAARCKTVADDFRMPARPRMQVWPVGAPIGHVLPFHA
jgi:hypothetical protein